VRVLILSADGFEDLELFVPLYRFLEEGIGVDIASTRKGLITGKHGYEIEVTMTLQEIRPRDYDALLLPGGKAPEEIRGHQKALDIVRDFFGRQMPVAALCHGPLILVSAGVITGRRATAYGAVAPELREAGVNFEDAEVVVDGNLITSRKPSDIPAFMREVMRMILR